MNYDFNNEEEIKQYLKNVGTEYRFGCLSERKPEVCHVFGEYLNLISNDIEKSSVIFKMNCDEYDYPRSCEAYGNYILTDKVKESPKHEVAFKYLSKSCDLNEPRGCYNAGIISFKGEVNNKKDYQETIRLMEKACNLKNDHACFFLSKLFIQGTPDKMVEKNMKNAFKYSLMSCELGNPKACFNISKMYQDGDGTEKNVERSEFYRKRAEKIFKFYYKN